MRLVALEDLVEGDVLGRSVFDSMGNMLAAAGFPLRERSLARLGHSGAGRLPVMELGTSRAPGELVRDVVQRRIARLVSNDPSLIPSTTPKPWTREAVADAMQEHVVCRGADLPAPVLSQLEGAIHEAVNQNLITLAALPGTVEDSVLERSVRVAILSLVFAEQFGYPKKERIVLATAALAHEFGRVLFSELAPNDVRSLDLERLLPREHPTFTALILLGSDPASLLEHRILWEQEERHHGKGFPRGRKGGADAPRAQRARHDNEMLPHSELLALAVAVDRLMIDPASGEKRLLLDVVTELYSGDTPAYHPEAMDLFCQLVQRFPVGSRVKIKTNASGKYLGFAGIVREVADRGNGHAIDEITLTHDPQGNEIDPVAFDVRTESRLQLMWQN